MMFRNALSFSRVSSTSSSRSSAATRARAVSMVVLQRRPAVDIAGGLHILADLPRCSGLQDEAVLLDPQNLVFAKSSVDELLVLAQPLFKLTLLATQSGQSHLQARILGFHRL